MEFAKQADAFANAKVGDHFFAYEVNPRKRVFLSCPNQYYWDNYLNKGRLYGYEIIRENAPCHLYIDLDVNREEYPNIAVEQIWMDIEKHIDQIFDFAMRIPPTDITKRIMHSTNASKGSMHIIYNIDGYLFKNNAHVGAFMQSLREYVNQHDRALDCVFEKGFVDMGIYTRNRQFRMLGCCKYNTDRVLTDNEPLTKERWEQCKVQPLHTTEELIDMETTGMKVSYTNSSQGVTGFIPDCLKPILREIESVHDTKVTRVHAFPLSLTFACNLRSKLCPFLKRVHTKNTLYAIINLNKMEYRIKCHSTKCKGAETDSCSFGDDMRRNAEDFMSSTVTVPTIRYD